ncbi:hypothetical protein SERLA73DRAFT_184655 [Serpula lacrymans var. lacrymans S7.3]|uniref:Uncharacterized protein n=2 Tax=Serpula lacrymans var. lacrymans TaxID=341189 RepID=F8Q4V6_SERL3|nr:uncharacterized protein SERLADRAFT_472554 [Serpula lacrymans var. lacrymans S7.9]EGN96583.1 hypothetical protein SERLA73DRAFT_184655 [Serpula lacrymans var. lacrymans S7.3]EGO22153.1 hypothetical protein SERLADRAFT_472554 [Serpula lacrymans var. lacrymans S7.9]
MITSNGCNIRPGYDTTSMAVGNPCCLYPSPPCIRAFPSNSFQLIVLYNSHGLLIYRQATDFVLATFSTIS